MRQILRFNKALNVIVISGDLIILNASFILLYSAFREQFQGNAYRSFPLVLVLLNLCYLICSLQLNAILRHRIVRAEQIIGRVIRNTVIFAILFISILTLFDSIQISTPFFVVFYFTFVVCSIVYRLFFVRNLIRKFRKQDCKVVLVGSNNNMLELYNELTNDPTSIYLFVGYFADTPNANFPQILPYLGHPRNVINYLEQNNVTQLYCSLPSSRSEEIIPIITYCENHLVRFFNVPNMRNYLKRRMWFELLGNTPILSIRQEPLSQTENQILKRAFDILFSSLFLITLFPIIYLIIGIVIKFDSPGPILFKQKRSGEDGQEFWCYKFRSMQVNAEADAVQATEHDPRKTKFGNFLRKSNIDELPQFINVLKGDMSIVGPRPHMLKHTAEYSQLVNKFMVRHFVKPGITGWSQVSGFRGETKELWQMEGRVQRDIWYIEHWSFMLDLLIIYKTIRNTIHGEKEAY